jgi:hypothetical protein
MKYMISFIYFLFFHLLFQSQMPAAPLRRGTAQGSSRHPRPSGGRRVRRGPLRPARGQVRDGAAGELRGDPAAALPSRPASRPARTSAGRHGPLAPWRPRGGAALARRLATCAAKCGTMRPAGSGGRCRASRGTGGG